YDTFAKDLSSLLLKINGSDRHVGKMPFRGRGNMEEQKSVRRLKNELSELVRNEEFEKAALLRDKIRDLEKKIDTEDEENADK
ncbi:MAG: hypothetical protein GF392_01905, partial [Candidatus Omnitrophica bacterium]|nr:hypothetical protein [Candidatus Omnitrophota bacterium]